jgi:hypothetical protein
MADESKVETKDDESKEDAKEEKTEMAETKDEEKKEEDKEKFEMSAKFEELTTKFTELEKECNELKEFKNNILEQEKASKVEFALNEVAKTMPKDKIEIWRNKVAEFANVDAWANALKADAFNYVVNKGEVKKEGINRIGLPNSVESNKQSKGLWD